MRCISNLSCQQAYVKVVGMQITKYLLRLCIYLQLDIGKVSCIKWMNFYSGSAWSSWNNFSTSSLASFSSGFWFSAEPPGILQPSEQNLSALLSPEPFEMMHFLNQLIMLPLEVLYQVTGTYCLRLGLLVSLFACWEILTVMCCFWKWSFKKSCFNRSVQPFQVLKVC